MAIRLLKKRRISGTVYDAGAELALSATDESYLVYHGFAEYIEAPVSVGPSGFASFTLDAEGKVTGLQSHSNIPYIAWDDLRFPADAINPAGTAAPPTLDDTTYGGTLLFSHSAENVIAGVAQMPHAWSRGTELHPHVHWSKTTSAAGGVVWQIRYAIANIGGTFGAYTDWASATNVVSDSDTANKHALAAFPDVDMTDRLESCMLAWQVRRNPDATADTYAASARLWEFDIHYQVSKLGTVDEIPE